MWMPPLTIRLLQEERRWLVCALPRWLCSSSGCLVAAGVIHTGGTAASRRRLLSWSCRNGLLHDTFSSTSPAHHRSDMKALPTLRSCRLACNRAALSASSLRTRCCSNGPSYSRPASSPRSPVRGPCRTPAAWGRRRRWSRRVMIEQVPFRLAILFGGLLIQLPRCVVRWRAMKRQRGIVSGVRVRVKCLPRPAQAAMEPFRPALLRGTLLQPFLPVGTLNS
jgi:hypothetical protein